VEDEFEKFKDKILKDGPRLGPGDPFCFECGPSLECFNRCCHDVNIFLTPYDIIRLKKRLGIDSEKFIDEYAVVPVGPGQKYPVVALRMTEDEAKACPFLREPEGCSVYEDRPWSCRMYPLGRAAPPKDGPQKGDPFYFLVEEEFCLGSKSGKEWTVSQWLTDQAVEDYDRIGEGFHDLVQRAPTGEETPDLTPQAMDMLFMVCYDLDRFRRFVFESKFLEMFEVSEDRVEEIRRDDVTLMEFGFDWVRFSLWRQPTMKIRSEVVEAKKARMESEKP
jgi:Fe-S-cluster containining protein